MDSTRSFAGYPRMIPTDGLQKSPAFKRRCHLSVQGQCEHCENRMTTVVHTTDFVFARNAFRVLWFKQATAAVKRTMFDGNIASEYLQYDTHMSWHQLGTVVGARFRGPVGR